MLTRGGRIIARRWIQAPLAALALSVGAVGVARGQALRLVDPGEERLVYELVDRIAPSAERVEVPLAKPWTTADMGRVLSEAGSPDADRDPAAARIADVLRRRVRRSSDGRASGAFILEVEPRVAVRAAAGGFELDPAFLSTRPRDGMGDPDLALEAGARVTWSWLPGRVSAVLDARATTNSRNRFDYRIRRDDPAGDVRSAYLLWQSDRFLVAGGRYPVEWGSGPVHGLGLTAGGPSLDGVLARLRAAPVQITLFTVFLPDERANRAMDAAGNTIPSSTPAADEKPLVDRYLFGHRVDVRAGDRLDLGFQEMALVTGVDRHLELRYATGLLPYYAVQNESDRVHQRDVNLGAGVQYRLRVGAGVSLYGEYFANEVFLDKNPLEIVRGFLGRRSNVQGFQQGVEWRNAFGRRGFTLQLEAVRLEHFLYLHRGLNTNWRADETPLGSFLGPDNQRLLLEVSDARPLGEGVLRWMTRVSFRERGIGRISSDEDLQGVGAPQPTPRGPVERSWLGGLEVQYLDPAGWEAGARLTGGRVKRLGNVPGETGNPLDAELYLTLTGRWVHAL